MRMVLKPLNTFVYVQPDEAGQVTPSGLLVIPEQARRPLNTGTILGVGDGILLDNGERVPLSVQPGDRVMYMTGGGVPIKLNDTEVLLMPESQIFGILTEVTE